MHSTRGKLLPPPVHCSGRSFAHCFAQSGRPSRLWAVVKERRAASESTESFMLPASGGREEYCTLISSGEFKSGKLQEDEDLVKREET